MAQGYVEAQMENPQAFIACDEAGNPIKTLGNVLRAAHQIGVSKETIAQWIEEGTFQSVEYHGSLANPSLKEAWISFREMMALDEQRRRAIFDKKYAEQQAYTARVQAEMQRIAAEDEFYG